MSISIVTVTYNSSRLIKRFIESINNQLGVDDIELLIIDNNSEDKVSLKKNINMTISKCKNINIIQKYRSLNEGFGASCNYGSKFSKYDFVLFINPDTILEKNSIEVLLKHSSDHNVDISGGKSLHQDSLTLHRTIFHLPTISSMLFEFCNLGKLFNISSNFYYPQNEIKDDMLVDGVGGAYMLFKKSSFQKLGGFDKNMFMYLEDVDICLRAKLADMKILYCPHSVISHIGGASSNSKYRIHHEKWFDSRQYYLRKNFPNIVSTIVGLIYKTEVKILAVRQKSKIL